MKIQDIHEAIEDGETFLIRDTAFRVGHYVREGFGRPNGIQTLNVRKQGLRSPATQPKETPQ